MRILKGQEILPDDSTLVQHNISDGDTLNILIEPEQDIEIEVKCGPKIYRHKVSRCMTVKRLKLLLIENNQVAFLYRNFKLHVTSEDNKQVLGDDSLPLHFYTLGSFVKLEAVGPTMVVESQNSFGDSDSHRMSIKATILELKKMIMKSRCDDTITDICMFVACEDDRYKQLDDEEDIPVCKLIQKDKTVYFIEDKLSLNRFNLDWAIHYQGERIGVVYGISKWVGSSYYSETVRSVKLLCIQQDMGVPTNCITVYRRKGNTENPRTDKDITKNENKIKSDSYIEIR